MTREEHLQALHDTFRECADDFYNKSDGADIEITPVYKKEPSAETLTYLIADISYRACRVQFRHTAHAPLQVASGILECYVSLDKDADGILIPLSMLLDYCDIDEPTPVCIPMITSPDGMREAFRHIGEVLLRTLPICFKACKDADQKNEILQCFFEEVNTHLSLKLPSPVRREGEHSILPYLNDGLYSFFTLRFCASPFVNVLQGEHELAKRKLCKMKKRMGFEERMLRLLESRKTEPKKLMFVSAGVLMLNRGGQQKISAKEFLSTFLAWILLTVVFSAAYVGVFLFFISIENRDALYLIGAMPSLPYCILGAFLSSILASYFLRFFIYRRLYSKEYDAYRAADYVQNSRGGDKLIKALLVLVAIVTVVGSAFFAKYNLKFTETGFIDNTKFFSFEGEYHTYKEITSVYYRPDRVNGFGETIAYPSWVLVLDDGREIDLYELDDIEAYENTLIPFLQEKIQRGGNSR